VLVVREDVSNDAYDDPASVLVLVVREDVSNDDAYDDAPKVLVLVPSQIMFSNTGREVAYTLGLSTELAADEA
jgi:hypothetical protein